MVGTVVSQIVHSDLSGELIIAFSTLPPAYLGDKVDVIDVTFKKENQAGLKIHYSYHGCDNAYRVHLNGEQVYWTKDARDRDIFIAELKARLILHQQC